jgi:hypothetical protein
MYFIFAKSNENTTRPRAVPTFEMKLKIVADLEADK